MLDTTVVLRLGDSGDTPLYMITSAALVQSRVVVASAGTHQVLFYDLDGTHTLAVGGLGRGPGEFAAISWMQVIGTRIFVYDWELNRISEFDTTGAFQGSVNIRPPDTYLGVQAVGVFPDGRILAQAWRTQTATSADPILYRDTLALLRYEADGSRADSVGAVVWVDKYAERWGRGGQIYIEVPLGRESSVVVAGWHYYIIENNDAGVAVYDTAGRMLRVIRPTELREARAASAADVSRARRDLASRLARGRNTKGIAERIPIPAMLPFYGWEGRRQLTMLRVDQAHNIWALEFGGLHGDRPVWHVFGHDGGARRAVGAHEEMDILYSDDTVALVRRWDSLDVETLELRRLGWNSTVAD